MAVRRVRSTIRGLMIAVASTWAMAVIWLLRSATLRAETFY